jgi:hypothetical protein
MMWLRWNFTAMRLVKIEPVREPYFLISPRNEAQQVSLEVDPDWQMWPIPKPRDGLKVTIKPG